MPGRVAHAASARPEPRPFSRPAPRRVGRPTRRRPAPGRGRLPRPAAPPGPPVPPSAAHRPPAAAPPLPRRGCGPSWAGGPRPLSGRLRTARLFNHSCLHSASNPLFYRVFRWASLLIFGTVMGALAATVGVPRRVLVAPRRRLTVLSSQEHPMSVLPEVAPRPPRHLPPRAHNRRHRLLPRPFAHGPHCPPRLPQDVRGHRTELDVRVLQDLVDAVGQPRLLARQLPEPGQVA